MATAGQLPQTDTAATLQFLAGLLALMGAAAMLAMSRRTRA
jgi:LPXTG-motif cell wall-anchored protein